MTLTKNTDKLREEVAAIADTFRALCAELTAWAEKTSAHYFQPPDVLLRARAALADEPAVPAPPADGEVAELPPRPPLMTPPVHPALERYGITWDGSPDKPLLTRMADGYWTPWHVAAELLQRLISPQPVPVSERLPGPEDMTDDGEVWIEDPGREYPLADAGDYDWEPHKWILRPIGKFDAQNGLRWLPAHALPLPEVGE